MYDTRTGKRVGMASCGMTEWQARWSLSQVRERDERGGRPDLHDLVPHLDVVELTEETWGSKPGDLIAPAREQS